MTKLKLGIGNGSLLQPVAWCLKQMGIDIDIETRSAWQEVSHDIVKRVFTSRPQHVVTYLGRGMLHCALIAQDMVYEYDIDRRLLPLRYFNISKSSLTTCAEVVLFAGKKSLIDSLWKMQPNSTLLSEYPRLTTMAFRQALGWVRSQTLTIIPSTGSTEGPVADGVYDYGVGIKDSGKSIRANGVQVVDTIMKAPLWLAISPDSNPDMGAIYALLDSLKLIFPNQE